MEEAFLYLIGGVLCCLILGSVYQKTETAKAKIESEKDIRKAEIYKDRHIQQARIENMAFSQGFNDVPPEAAAFDINSIMAMANTPQGQEFIQKFLGPKQ